MQTRLTHQRTLISKIIKESKEHPSADEVYAKARMIMPKISLGTVYRNLRHLVEEGSIREIRFNIGPSRYDGVLETHGHFICDRCGAVFDIQPSLHLPTLEGKSITGYRLDFFGRCEQCLSK